MSSTFVDQSSLTRGPKTSHDTGAVPTKRWRSETVSDSVRDQPTTDVSENVVPRHLVAAALGRLTQEHRDVLRECYFRGRSVAQAAHELGITPGAVKSRTYYALRALRLVVEELRGAE